MIETSLTGQTYPHIHREWSVLALTAAVLTGIFFLLLWLALDAAFALRWLPGVIAAQIYLFGSLWSHLHENRLKTAGPGSMFPTLGLANRITIFRAVLFTWTAGFLFNSWPAGLLAWAPGILFLSAVIMDYLDGAAARHTGQVTELGAWLDIQWDSLGVLFASFLLVRYGQVPPLYAVVGLARYLYLFGLWVHAKRGGVVGELPPSRIRRVVGGMQMGFIAAALVPVLGPPITYGAAVVFMAPVLFSFLRDFLAVTGRNPQAGEPRRQR